MSTLRSCRPVALLLLLVLWPGLGLAQSAPPAGVVTGLQGQATIVRPVIAQPIPLKFKDDLFLRDQVQTRENSLVRVLLGGKALVTIRELSTFAITEEPGRAAVDLKSGKIAVGVAKSLLKAGEVIEIHTPNAIAAVRGSLLVASVVISGGVPQSYFTALDASLPITVTPLAGGGASVALQVNQAVGVSGTGANTVVGPVQNVTPDVARREAQTASAPREADPGSLSSPMAGEISAAKFQEATALASLIAGPSATAQPTPTPQTAPTDSTLTSATQTQLLQESGSTLTLASQTAVQSTPPPPSTSSLGVNAQATEQAVATEGSSSSTLSGAGETSGTSGTGGAGGTGGTGSTGGTGGTGGTGSTGGTGGTGSAGGTGGSGGTGSGTGGQVLISGQNLTLAANQTLKTFAGPSSSTDPGAAVAVTNSTVTGADNLIVVDPGATASLAGPLLNVTGSTTSDPGGNLVNIGGGSITSSSALPFVFLGSSTVTTGQHLVRIASGSNVNLAGSLVSAQGMSVTVSDPAVNAFGFLNVLDGSKLTSTSTSALLAFDASTVDSGAIVSVRRSPSPFAASTSSTLTLSGPLFSAINGSTFDLSRLGLGATVGTAGGPCCSVVSLTQGGQLFSSTTAPLLQVTNSTIKSGPDLQSGGSIFNVADTFTGAPTTELVAPSNISLAGPLLRSDNGTITALFHLLRVGNSTFSSASVDPLIQLNNSTVSLGGSDPFSNNVTSSAHVLSLSGTTATSATLSLHGPLFSAASSILTTTAEPFGIFAGGSLSAAQTTDPLISLSGGTVNAGAHFMQVRGFANGGSVPATVTLSDPLLRTDGTTLNVTGNLLRLADGGSLLSNTTSPLITLNGGSFTGAPSGSGLGGSLLRMFSEVGQAGTFLSISGPYLVSSNLPYSAPDAAGFNIADGAIVNSAGSGAFASFVGGSVSTQSSFFVMSNHTSFATSGQPTTVGNGVIPNVTLAGSLLSFQGTGVTIGNPTTNTSTLLVVLDGSTLTGTGSQPLLILDGANVDLAGSVLSLRRSALANPSTLTLSGPLFSATNNSTVNTTSLGFGPSFGVPGGCCTGFFISQGAQLISNAAAPLIQLTGSTFNAGPDSQSGGDLIGIFNTFGGAPLTELVAPPTVTLLPGSGALLKADSSAITTLFSLLNIGRGNLFSSSSDPLIQLTGTTVSLGGVNAVGNAPTFGGLFIEFASVNGGTVDSPATVSLAGPLLLATNSNLTMTRDLVGVFNGATLTSTGADPLVQLNGGVLTTSTASGFNGFVLDVSGTGGPNGSAGLASVTLNGPVYSGTGTLHLAGGLANVTNGGQLTLTGLTSPVFAITGGIQEINTNPNFAMLRLLGRNITQLDTESGLNLGTDRPIKDGTGGAITTPLLETTGAAVSGQKVLKIDHALLEATAPLLSLRASGTTQSIMTTTADAIDISFNARVSALGSSLLRLDNSVLNVNSGALVNVNASKLTVGGDLVSLVNGATLSILNGPLLAVNGGGFAKITGALVSFGGTGGNAINVTNGLVPTGFINGVPVFSSLGGTTGFGFTNSTPLVGLNTAGTIKVNGTLLPNNATAGSGITGSLIAIQGTGGQVKIGP